MKEIPNVYVNPINEKIKYQERVFVDENKVDYDDILTKDKYSFNHIYLINLKDNNIIKSSIIKITDNFILTIDGDWIKKDDILSISEIKK